MHLDILTYEFWFAFQVYEINRYTENENVVGLPQYQLPQIVIPFGSWKVVHLDTEFPALMWDSHRMDLVSCRMNIFKVRTGTVDVRLNHARFSTHFPSINNALCYRYGVIFSFLGSMVIKKKKDISIHTT